MKILVSKTNRDWLVAVGADTLRFLSGMWTCDIKRAADQGRGATGRGFLLNSKGKLVSEAQFYVVSKNEILFSIPSGYGLPVKNALEKLLVADDVELKNDTPFDDVWVVPQLPTEFQKEWNFNAKHFDWKIPDALDKVFASYESDSLVLIPKLTLGDSHGELWIKKNHSQSLIEKLGGSIEFISDIDSFRTQAIVPAWGVDFKTDDLILEFPHKDAISFFKGCYIGQEVVARATYRGRLNKGFARFTFEQTPQLGFIYSTESPDQPIGKITTVSQHQGLGLVRLSFADSAYFESPAKSLFQPIDGHLEKVNRITKVDLASG